MAVLLREMPQGGHDDRHVFDRNLITFDRLRAGQQAIERSRDPKSHSL
jgi:hypothetical protein